MAGDFAKFAVKVFIGTVSMAAGAVLIKNGVENAKRIDYKRDRR